MGQVFQRRSNTLARAAIACAVILVTASGWLLYAVYWSPYTTTVDVPREQAVPFSHKHHAGDLGIDCRYCHTSVEKSAFAGIPPTETCMTCHSQLWTDAPMLAPIRDSLTRNQRLSWTRVHQLPDFVFFDHSIHVNKGVGCATCHGRVDEMPLTWKENTLYMKWCLECHRDPAKYVRPANQIFSMTWQNTNQAEAGDQILAEHHIHVTQLTDCSMCHR